MPILQADDIADLITTTQRNLGEMKWTDLSFTLQEHIFINRLYIRRLHQNGCYIGHLHQKSVLERERAAHGQSLLNGFAALGEVGSWGAPVMVGRPSGEGRGVEAARCLGSSRCCC